MRKYFLLCIVFISITNSYSQKTKTVKGSVITNFGATYNIENPDLLLKTDTKYKVIFDVYSDGKNKEKINSSINTVARFLNMHEQNGTKPENLEVVLVLHGAATKNALSNTAFKNKFKSNNPNSVLIKALKNAHVKVYVCGQSFIHSGYSKKDLSKNVKLSLSALTSLVYYQTEGYQLITFN